MKKNRITAVVSLVILFLASVPSVFGQKAKRPVVVGALDHPDFIISYNNDDVLAFDPKQPPEKAAKAFTAFMQIGVQVFALVKTEDNLYWISQGMGTVVRDHKVLVSYHLLAKIEKIKKEHHLSGEVYFQVADETALFSATLEAFDVPFDLILLRVSDGLSGNTKFSQKPIPPLDLSPEFQGSFFSFAVREDVDASNKLSTKFLYAEHPGFIGYQDVVIRLGDQEELARLPSFSGSAREGFSGGPILDSDGAFRGMVRAVAVAGSPRLTYITPSAQIAVFLESTEQSAP